MNKKPLLLLGVCLFLTLVLFGCSSKEGGQTDAEYNVVLYFVSSEYIKTGDESLPSLIATRDYKILCAEGKQYESMIHALRTAPEGADTMITDKIQFNRIEADGGTVYVDFVGEGLSGGSLEEGMLISQIVDSMIDSFGEIEQVQFLVDGEIVESIMGHFDATEPYHEGVGII